MLLISRQNLGKGGCGLALAFCLATLVASTPLHPGQTNAAKPAIIPAPATAGAVPDRIGTGRDLSPLPAGLEQLQPRPEEESLELQKALTSASGNPQTLIKNLEQFLARFPQSQRREEVLRTIFREALQANDPGTAAVYAEKLLEVNPDNSDILRTLVDLLERQGDAASRERAIRYATRFVERSEKLGGESKPPDVPAEKWQETKTLMRATAYFLRGRLHAKSGESRKAFADYEVSYQAYPTSQVAERLGDLAAKGGENDRAIYYYATAFAFPDPTAEPARRDELRRKLGSAYILKYKSEKGLGDMVLAQYDELSRSLRSRFESRGSSNAGVRDPFDSVLLRPDGSQVRLSDFRGKVVVMDFWATWCEPCRVEGKLLERVIQNFRNEPAAAFLAVNVDEDRGRVPSFLKEEHWTVPVVYAQGFDRLLGVRSLPTLMIFDREGRVVFRQEGLNAQSFAAALQTRVRQALAQSLNGSMTQ